MLMGDFFLIIGAIHKRRRQFRGVEGGQIDDMGRYEGVGVKENPISSIQDWQIIIFS